MFILLEFVDYNQPIKRKGGGGMNTITRPLFEPTFKDSQEAFKDAISAKRLSDNQADRNFAGLYMYMGTWEGKDHFKNIISRSYDV